MAGVVFEAVQPGKQFRDRHVKFRRNAGVQVHLHQQGDQFRAFMHIDAGFAGAGDDFSGDQAASLGHDTWRTIAGVVRQGNGFGDVLAVERYDTYGRQVLLGVNYKL